MLGLHANTTHSHTLIMSTEPAMAKVQEDQVVSQEEIPQKKGKQGKYRREKRKYGFLRPRQAAAVDPKATKEPREADTQQIVISSVLFTHPSIFYTDDSLGHRRHRSLEG